MKDQFSLHYIDENCENWRVINRAPMIYYKTRVSETFGFQIPYSDGQLISWYKEQVDGEVVPSISMFLNGQQLSTQVPMHHKYYTNTIEMENINGALRNTTITYTEQFYDIKTLQMVVKGEYYEC